MAIQQMLLGIPSASEPADPGGSMFFEGTGGNDHIKVTSAGSQYQLGTGDFTLECWIKTTTDGSDGFYRRIYLQDSESQNYQGHLQLAVTPNAGLTRINPWDDGTLNIVGTSNLSDGEWHHIALCRTSGNARVWVDGHYEGDQSWTVSVDGQQPRIGSQNGSGGWEGLISNLRLIKGQALYSGTTMSPSVPTAKLDNIEYTIILAAQESAYGEWGVEPAKAGWTATGYARTSDDSPFLPDPTSSSSVEFDGSNDALNLSANYESAPGTGDFTYEGWFWSDSQGSGRCLFDTRNGTGTVTNGIYVGRMNAHNYQVEIYSDGGYRCENGIAFPENEWVHIAVVRYNGVVKLYQNGQKVGDDWTTSNNMNNNTIRVGRNYSGAEPWDGKIANFRFIKHQALYKENFAPSTLPIGLSSNGAYRNKVHALCCHDSSSVTSVIRGMENGQSFSRSITTDGSPQIYNDTPYVMGKAALFNGSSYLEIPDSSDWDFGGGEFTVECWYYPKSHGGWEGLVHQWPSNNYNTTNGWCLEPVGGTLDFYYCRSASSDLDHATGPSTQIPLNQWNHCAAVRLGNSIRVFLNGTHGGSKSFAGNIQNGTGPLRIGGGCAGAGNVDGYISNVRVTKGQAVYWNNFTPSTTELTKDYFSTNPNKVKLLACQSAIKTAARVSPGNITISGGVGITDGPF